MTKDEARRHFGNYTELAKALGIKQPSISLWGEFPPPLRQLQLEALTGGVLKAEPGIVPPMTPTMGASHRESNSPQEVDRVADGKSFLDQA